MKYIITIFLISWFYSSKAQIKQISLVLQEQSMSDYVFNNLYFGNNNDMVIFRNMLIKKEQSVVYGYIRFKCIVKRDLFLLLHTEYIEMNGYCFAPIVGVRKLF